VLRAIIEGAAERQTIACSGTRKVRTPQGGAPVNGRSGRPEGKWHRKHTADAARQARVKRCGKSAPHPWQHGWQAKPRTEQGQIGGLSRRTAGQRTARPMSPGRLLDPVSDDGARGMIVVRRSSRQRAKVETGFGLRRSAALLPPPHSALRTSHSALRAGKLVAWLEEHG
jgi:hypothetical protein